MQIKDRVAVITGAASGIGKATATEIVARGIHAAAIVDINSDINDVASEINNGAERDIVIPVSYTHLTLPTNREV